MVHRKILIYLTLMALAVCAEATCQTYADYCKNITVPRNFNPFIPDTCMTSYQRTYGLSLSEFNGLSDIDGVPYNAGAFDRVNITVWNATNTKYDLYLDNVTSWDPDKGGTFTEQNTYFIKLIRKLPTDPVDTDTGGVVVSLCLGTVGTYSYPYNYTFPVFNQTCIQAQTINDFTEAYRRNWTFRYEENSSLVYFNNKNATLSVSCPTSSLFNINLTDKVPTGGSYTVWTKEQPVYDLFYKDDGMNWMRADKDIMLKDNYYLRKTATQYTLNLVDYTSSCNDLLIIKKTINDAEDIVWSGYYGLSHDAYPWLDNQSYYKFIQTCRDGSIRDFGSIMLGSTTSRNLEVTNINLGGGVTRYAGGLALDFSSDYGAGILSLNYAKDTGTIGSVNFTVYNLSANPMTELSSTVVTGVTNGSLNYNIQGNDTYWMTAVVVNEGMTVEKSEAVILYNTTGGRLVDFHLPSTVMGLSDTTIYKSIVMIGAVVMGLGFAAIDAGFAAVVVVGWFLLTDLFGWVSIPAFLKVVIAFMALGLLWNIARRHDE
jgi:hypothetical protein